MVRYRFEILGLHRICSNHFGSNPASGRVMQKIGMIRQGTGREHYKKWGEYEDRVGYGLPTRE
jgi:[ribosomal protein S5]-alanine N-acetyltransferase